MAAIWLALFVVLSIMAISTAKGAKWKLTNLGIILAFAAAGFGLAWAAGAWGHNMEIGGMIAVPLTTFLGIAGALGCWRRNKKREKKEVVPAA